MASKYGLHKVTEENIIEIKFEYDTKNRIIRKDDGSIINENSLRCSASKNKPPLNVKKVTFPSNDKKFVITLK